MNVPSQSELTHLQLQAMMRDNHFPPSEILYLGLEDGEHYYLINGEHRVPASLIEGLERCD